MERDLRAAADAGAHDVLVIGGGIIGTAIARDAALRGLDVLLVEKQDLGYGTSSRSTRLAHGGLRYLENWDLGLVREALLERERLLRNAPHLVKPLRFILPAYTRRELWKLRVGLRLYDALGSGGLPRSEMLGPGAALAAEPSLRPEGLVGAGSYWDCRITSVERLCLENALDAAEAGARICTHAEVTGLLRETGLIAGAHVRDALTADRFQLRARIVVNAAGPWVPEVAGLAKAPVAARRSRGSHLVVPNFLRNAVLMRARSDGRYVFAVPLDGEALLGTTDLREERSPDDVQCSPQEARYLLEEARQFLNADLRPHYATCGVRLLVDSPGKGESDLSRRHEIRDHTEDDVPGLWSVLGGKITTMRAVAEQVVDRACRVLGSPRWCETRDRPLPGGKGIEEGERKLLAEAGNDEDRALSRHLVARYGGRAPEVWRLASPTPALRKPLCPHSATVRAEILFAAREEGALTLADALLRRTDAGNAPCQADDSALRAADVLADELRWSPGRRDAELSAFRAFTLGRLGFLASPG